MGRVHCRMYFETSWQADAAKYFKSFPKLVKLSFEIDLLSIAAIFCTQSFCNGLCISVAPFS